MKSILKSRFSRIITILVLGYVLLFIFRIAEGYSRISSDVVLPEYANYNPVFDGRLSKQNIATVKYKSNHPNGINTPSGLDQKYEKIADIQTTSTRYVEEEKQARDEIKHFNALIQYEMKSGNEGSRNLHLIIGVPPENFDTLYQHLTAIGKVNLRQITKTDKTNEYKELNAKKKTLENTRASLIELKTKNGYISDYISLEQQIMEIDQQLQNLGVSLGDFDEEKEFCTVKFYLSETTVQTIGLMQRIKVALVWTTKVYLSMMIILVLIMLFANLLLRTFSSYKKIESKYIVKREG